MVYNDLGVTFIPSIAKKSALMLEPEIEVHELNEDSYREIGLVWRKNSSHYDEFTRFGEYIRHCHDKQDRL